jgi:hypothetical protein
MSHHHHKLADELHKHYTECAKNGTTATLFRKDILNPQPLAPKPAQRAQRPANYYRLHADELTLHLSREQLLALQQRMTTILKHKSRAHREYHVSVMLKGRIWTKLSITSHEAHKRHCAQHDDKPWVTR